LVAPRYQANDQAWSLRLAESLPALPPGYPNMANVINVSKGALSAENAAFHSHVSRKLNWLRLV